MGKQLSFYLDELEAKKLTEIAIRECRRPPDQARYLLRLALGLSDAQKHESAVPTYQGSDGALVEVNP